MLSLLVTAGAVKALLWRAKGLGAHVYVTEVDPIKAVEAVFDGFKVLPMIEAAKVGDIFCTVTGCKDVIVKEHYEVMKDKAIMCNAGHFDCEVNVAELADLAVSHERVRQNIEAIRWLMAVNYMYWLRVA